MDPSIQKLKEDVGALQQTIIEKDIFIRKLNVRVYDLEKEVESNSKQISDLQTHSIKADNYRERYFDRKAQYSSF